MKRVLWKIDEAKDLPLAIIEDDQHGTGVAEIGTGKRTRRNLAIAREIVQAHNAEANRFGRLFPLKSLEELTNTGLEQLQQDVNEEIEKRQQAENYPSTVDSPEIRERVLRSARKTLHRRSLSAYFEHNQWWITHTPSGAQWSVVDAEGPGVVEGFDFEQVSEGDNAD